MPVVHGDVADCPSRSSPEWAAQKEFALLTLVAEHGTSKTKKLFMQKQRIITMHLQSTGGQPSQRRAATGAAAQQNAGRRPAPTECQLARRERSQKRLRQKHLASKMWACIRVASRLLAWRARACAAPGGESEVTGRFLILTRKPLPSGPPGRIVFARPHLTRKMLPVAFLAKPTPAAPALPAPPPVQPSPAQLAAAARASLDETELQDARGSKRDATARTPPPKSNPTNPNPTSPRMPAPAGTKKSRGGAACAAALAAAAPAAAPQQCTATTYATAALAASNPPSTPTAPPHRANLTSAASSTLASAAHRRAHDWW